MYVYNINLLIKCYNIREREWIYPIQWILIQLCSYDTKKIKKYIKVCSDNWQNNIIIFYWHNK